MLDLLENYFENKKFPYFRRFFRWNCSNYHRFLHSISEAYEQIL